MAPDPNQIDISLSLLPGESKTVIDNLIKELQNITTKMGNLSIGDQSVALAQSGPMARLSPTGSNDEPVDVNIVSVSPTASFAGVAAPTPSQPIDSGSQATTLPNIPTQATLANIEPGVTPGTVSAGQQQSKLGEIAANQAGIQATPVPAPGEGSPTSSDSTIGGTSSDGETVVDNQERQSRTSKLYNTTKNILIPRKEITQEQQDAGETKGSVDWGSMGSRAVNYAQSSALLGMNQGKDELGRMFAPSNLQSTGGQLGGDIAPSINFGGFLGNHIIPGTSYAQAAGSAVGIGDPNSAAAKGSRLEADAFAAAKNMKHIGIDEARQAQHAAIGTFGANAGDQANTNLQTLSQLRSTKDGGLSDLQQPELQKSMDAAMRDGSTSVNDVTKAFQQMPSAAKAARMGIHEYIAAAQEMASTLHQQGASYKKAMAAPNEAATISGQTPESAMAMRQAPIVQGALAAKGLLPEIQGQASSAQVYEAAMPQMKQIYGTLRKSFKPIVKHTPYGDVVQETAREQALAKTGNLFGTTGQEVGRLMNRSSKTLQKANVTDALKGYTQSVERVKHGAKSSSELAAGLEAERTGIGAVASDVTRPEVMQQLEKAHITGKALQAVRAAKTPEAFSAAANKALGIKTSQEQKASIKGDQTMNDVNVHVNVNMKGDAAKYFKDAQATTSTHTKAKKEANSGRGSYNHNNPDGDVPSSKSLLDMMKMGAIVH